MGGGQFHISPGKLPRFPASMLEDRGVSDAFWGEGAVCRGELFFLGKRVCNTTITFLDGMFLLM